MSEVQKEPPMNKRLLSVVDEYLVDLECLRDMQSSVMPFLHEQDQERKGAVKRILDSARKKGEELKLQEEESSDPENSSNESEDDNKSSEDDDKDVRLAFSPPDYEYLMANLNKIQKAERLFEKQLIVTLVSRFDEFLGQVLRLVLEQKPESIISSNKTITYKELVALKSVDKAIEGVIHKEVEDILRESHESQIQYIDEKLKIGIQENFKGMKKFLEVAERRNLFVHSGGVVSNQYIDRCKGFGHEVSVDRGRRLDADNEYFNDAFLTFFEIGLRIGQASYRRIFNNDLDSADRALNNLAVKFMNSGEYHLAEVITDFDIAIPEKLRSPSSEFFYYAKINKAASQKFQGKDFEKGLSDVPWQVFHSKYSLVLHVLREEYEEAGKLMQNDEVKDIVGMAGFRAWPVFRLFRETDEFKKAYKAIYGREYIPDFDKDQELREEQENKALESDG